MNEFRVTKKERKHKNPFSVIPYHFVLLSAELSYCNNYSVFDYDIKKKQPQHC